MRSLLLIVLILSLIASIAFSFFLNSLQSQEDIYTYLKLFHSYWVFLFRLISFSFFLEISPVLTFSIFSLPYSFRILLSFWKSVNHILILYFKWFVYYSHVFTSLCCDLGLFFFQFWLNSLIFTLDVFSSSISMPIFFLWNNDYFLLLTIAFSFPLE